jgi:hypothetical protein
LQTKQDKLREPEEVIKMVRNFISIVSFIIGFGLFTNQATADKAERSPTDLVATISSTAKQRCGWFDNPTPANFYLTDRDGHIMQLAF